MVICPHRFTSLITAFILASVASAQAGDDYRARIDEAWLEASADRTANTWTLVDRTGTTYRFGTSAGARLFTGVDTFLHLGCDVLEILQSLHRDVVPAGGES